MDCKVIVAQCLALVNVESGIFFLGWKILRRLSARFGHFTGIFGAIFSIMRDLFSRLRSSLCLIP